MGEGCGVCNAGPRALCSHVLLNLYREHCLREYPKIDDWVERKNERRTYAELMMLVGSHHMLVPKRFGDMSIVCQIF